MISQEELEEWLDSLPEYDPDEDPTLARNQKPKPASTIPKPAYRRIVDKHPPQDVESANGLYMMTLAEMVAAARMALRGERPFAMSDPLCNNICTPWFERQRQRDLRDLALVCRFMIVNRPDVFSTDKMAVICWYADGSMSKVTVAHDTDGMTPKFSETFLPACTLAKPLFPDNKVEFCDALLDIGWYAGNALPFSYWQEYFLKAAQYLDAPSCTYEQHKVGFYLPQHYYKYLMAVTSSFTGAGMGSWYDLPITGDRPFRITTDELAYQQCRALLYAVNNC